jgi:hypothetical protein
MERILYLTYGNTPMTNLIFNSPQRKKIHNNLGGLIKYSHFLRLVKKEGYHHTHILFERLFYMFRLSRNIYDRVIEI